jgi:hypothetical protein
MRTRGRPNQKLRQERKIPADKNKQTLIAPHFAEVSVRSILMLMPIKCSSDRSFTRLYAHIIEEYGAFTVRARLFNDVNGDYNVWGEEIARSFENASQMIERLATRFGIDQNCISIKIVMRRCKDSTIH